MGAFSPKYGKWQHCPVNDLYADGAEQSRSHGVQPCEMIDLNELM